MAKAIFVELIGDEVANNALTRELAAQGRTEPEYVSRVGNRAIFELDGPIFERLSKLFRNGHDFRVVYRRRGSWVSMPQPRKLTLAQGFKRGLVSRGMPRSTSRSHGAQ